MTNHNIDNEIRSIISFLTKRHPSIFRKGPELDTLEITDRVEALILSGIVQDSFFIQSQGNELTDYNLSLYRGFTSEWARDHQKTYPQLFKEGKVIVKFFPYWMPMRGHSTERYSMERKRQWLSKIGNKEPRDILYVPYYEYGSEEKSSQQFGEGIYHYLSGLVFRDMGYLVCDEYTPHYFGQKIPDLSAIKSPEIASLLSKLRSKGIISNGAFEQELQLYTIFGRSSSIPHSSAEALTQSEAVAIEVKRAETVMKGIGDLENQLSEAYGLYDEGYLVAPLSASISNTRIGFMSFGADGQLLFVKPKQTQSATLQPNELGKRHEQLRDVLQNAFLQLLKNLPLSEAISFCVRNNASTDSFQALMSGIDKTDIDLLIDELIERKGAG